MPQVRVEDDPFALKRLMSPAKPLPRQDLELILEHTAPLWEEVRGQHIFLTGGTGFFGCWLVESFCHVNQALGLDARMVVLTRNPAGFAAKCPHLATNSAIELHTGDVRSFTFPDGEYRYVIHAATQASTKLAADAPVEMLSTIIAGTERTLEFSTAHGARKTFSRFRCSVWETASRSEHVPEG